MKSIHYSEKWTFMQNINNDRNALKLLFLKVFKITDFKNNF